MYYLRNRFVKKSLKVLHSLRVGPCFALKTLERTREMHLGPRGRPAAVRPQIRRGLAGVRPGKSRGRAQGLPWFDLCAWLGEKDCRRGWTAAPGGDRRWSSCSGEPPAGERQRAVRVALRWSREGVAKHWLAGCGPDGGAQHYRDGRLAACVRMAGSGLYRRAASCLSDEGSPL
jgi:hypothetical protein